MSEDNNVRENMELISNWLGWQSEDLSDGLKSIADAEKLYNYWFFERDDLPEMADDCYDDEGRLLAMFRVKALGYDPLLQYESSLFAEAKHYHLVAGLQRDWLDFSTRERDEAINATRIRLEKEYKI